MIIIPEEMNANPTSFSFQTLQLSFLISRNDAIMMEAMDWPSKLNAIVIEAPRTEKLILLKEQ